MAHNLTKSLLRSSFQSSTPSVSTAAKSSTKGVGCGLKHVKTGVNRVIRPVKWARCAWSITQLSPAISDNDDHQSLVDQGSINSKVIDVISDGEELKELEKELGMSDFLFFLAVSFILIYSCCQANLEVSNIFFF
jgi:hypothetical protein